MTLLGPENGHLRMPNPIVDRLALLRLNGTQWQILWAVWRRTLCWQKSGNWGNRPYPISISELVEATRLNLHQVKRETHLLVDMNILIRDKNPGGRGHKPMTSFNLDFSSWKVPKGSFIATVEERVAEETPIEVEKGSESVTPTVEELHGKSSELAPQTVANKIPITDKSATLSLANSKLGNKQKKLKETPSTKVEETKTPDPLAPQTPASKYLFEKTGRKRWKNLVQKEEFEKAEVEVGEDRMKEAINWALLSNISNIKSILTAARKGGKRDDAGKGRGPDADKPHSTGGGFSGFRAIESGPDD